MNVDVYSMPFDFRVSLDDGAGTFFDVASYTLRRHAESHARRIRAALDWRPGDGDPWAAHVAAQDERIARLEAELREARERVVTLGEPLRFDGPTTALNEANG